MSAATPWITSPVLQEERALRERMRQEALRFTEQLEDDVAIVAQKLRSLVLQGELEEASSYLSEALRNEGTLRANLLVYERNNRLLGLLKTLRSLEMNKMLPGVPEDILPGEFFAAIQERPRVFRALLLSALDEEKTPEENLAQVLDNLADNLALWGDTPSLLPPEETLARQRLCRDLTEALSWLRGSLEIMAPLDRGRYLTLLRWRLERCENPLVLPEAWVLPRWDKNLMELVVGILEKLDVPPGGTWASPLSPVTWDALLEKLLELWGRAREFPSGRAQHGGLDAAGACQGLLEGTALRDALVALEQEGLAELAPEMRSAFLESTILGLAPQLEEVLSHG